MITFKEIRRYERTVRMRRKSDILGYFTDIIYSTVGTGTSTVVKKIPGF